jgi:hypothetical protein
MNWASTTLIVLLFLAVPLVAQESNGASQAVPADVMKQLESLTKRVEQLEQQLREHESALQPTTVVPSAKASAPAQRYTAPVEAAVIPAQSQLTAQPTKPKTIVPFSDWDWTWLNGNPRNKDMAFDSKFFTPEIRADVTCNYDFNKPIDNSIGGSSEIFRSNEIQLLIANGLSVESSVALLSFDVKTPNHYNGRQPPCGTAPYCGFLWFTHLFVDAPRPFF